MATSVLSVRVNEAEKTLLEMAAKHAHTNLSDFIRRKALESAEMEILDKTYIEIPAENWEAFESWLNEPPKVTPELKRLMQTKPAWE